MDVYYLCLKNAQAKAFAKNIAIVCLDKKCHSISRN